MYKAQLGDKIIKVVFFKVTSGMEEKVEREITAKVIKAGIINFRFFKVFGLFDLLLIYESDKSSKSLLRQGTFPNLLNSIVFDCFTWQTPLVPDELIETFNFNRIESPLLGVIFYKIKPEIFREYQARIDLAFVDLFTEENAAVLGCLGWADAVVLMPGNSIVTLAEEMDQLANLKIPRDDGSYQRLALKTYSFMTINFGICKKILTEQKLSSDLDLGIEQDSMGRVYPVLEISCRPDAQQKVIEGCLNRFGSKPVLLLGKDDLVVNKKPKKQTWPNFLGNLLFFRKELSEELYSTSVRIFNSRISSLKGVVPTTPAHVPFPEISQWLDKIPDDDFGKGLLRKLYTLSQYAQNDLIADDVKSVFPFISHFMENYLELEKSDFSPRNLYSLMQLLETGVNQRLIGAYVSTEEIHSGIQYHKGGIQKILAAAEVIPRTILSLLGLPWHGFVVVGSALDYRHDLDIINLPGKTWADPTLWWGLFHEIGHLYALYHPAFSDAYLNDCVQKSFQAFPLPGRVGASLSPQKPYGEGLRFLLEIAADAFDLRYGFLFQTDLYLKTIWSYLISEHRSNLENKINDYITRSISSIIVNKIILSKKNVTDKADILKLIKINEFISHLNNLGVDLREFRINIENIEYQLLKSLPDFILYLVNTMKKDNDMVRAMQHSFKSRKFANITDNIEKGFVYTQRIDYPHLLILRFLQMEKVDSKTISTAAKLALIKTLWYQSLFHLPNKDKN